MNNTSNLHEVPPMIIACNVKESDSYQDEKQFVSSSAENNKQKMRINSYEDSPCNSSLSNSPAAVNAFAPTGTLDSNNKQNNESAHLSFQRPPGIGKNIQLSEEKLISQESIIAAPNQRFGCSFIYHLDATRIEDVPAANKRRRGNNLLEAYHRLATSNNNVHCIILLEAVSAVFFRKNSFRMAGFLSISTFLTCSLSSDSLLDIVVYDVLRRCRALVTTQPHEVVLAIVAFFFINHVVVMYCMDLISGMFVSTVGDEIDALQQELYPSFLQPMLSFILPTILHRRHTTTSLGTASIAAFLDSLLQLLHLLPATGLKFD